MHITAASLLKSAQDISAKSRPQPFLITFSAAFLSSKHQRSDVSRVNPKKIDSAKFPISVYPWSREAEVRRPLSFSSGSDCLWKCL